MYNALSEPVEAWHFDFGAPPEESDHKALDLHFHTRGRMNAVLFWFELHLIDGIRLSTGPHAVGAGESPPPPPPFPFMYSSAHGAFLFPRVSESGSGCSHSQPIYPILQLSHRFSTGPQATRLLLVNPPPSIYAHTLSPKIYFSFPGYVNPEVAVG
jgi:hypothetical protein